MTSHGVSKHGRLERLLRKHRLDTRENGGQELMLDDVQAVNTIQKTTRSKNLHDEWVAGHEKRQQVNTPSAIAAAPNSPTMDTADADPIPSTTMGMAEQEAAASEPTDVSSDLDHTILEASSTTDPGDAPTKVTAVTTVTSIVSYPTANAPTADAAEEPAVETASKITNLLHGAATTATASDEPSATELTPAETSTVATEIPTEVPTESVTDPATNTLPTEEVSSESPTVATTDVPTESATDEVSGTATLSQTLSEPTGIIATLSAGITSLLPIPTTFPTVSVSVPIINQPSASSKNTPIFIGSSLNLPTHAVSTYLPSATSAHAVMGTTTSSSNAGSNSSSDTTTDLTTTTTSNLSLSTSTTGTTSTTTATTTTTTSHTSETSYSDSPYHGGSGWGTGGGGGGGNTSETTGSSSDSNTSSNSGPGPLSPQTTGKIVGGVVGGVAAASVIFLLIWFLLRRRRKTGFFFGSPANRSIADDGGNGGLIEAPSSTREMTPRNPNKDSIFGAAYFAPAFMKRWRQSQVSTGGESFTSTTPSSERGFQKISGRKMPSGMSPDFENSRGARGGSLEAGSGSPTESDFSSTFAPIMPRSQFSSQQPPTSNPLSSPLDTNFTREAPEDDVVFMRPSPARMPTSGSANSTPWNEAAARTSTMPLGFPSPPMTIPKRPDALGRSHPSYDGSRGSRFTESL